MPAAISVLAALSYDVVLIETVGVGQSEIEIAAVADPTVVVLNPGAGDAIQAAKAGLLEVADIVAVNKADREGADQTARDLRAETSAPILKIVAAQNEGIAELVEAIDDHLRADDPERRAARARAQVLSLAQSALRTHPGLDALAAEVAEGRRRRLHRGEVAAATSQVRLPKMRMQFPLYRNACCTISPTYSSWHLEEASCRRQSIPRSPRGRRRIRS